MIGPTEIDFNHKKMVQKDMDVFFMCSNFLQCDNVSYEAHPYMYVNVLLNCICKTPLESHNWPYWNRFN